MIENEIIGLISTSASDLDFVCSLEGDERNLSFITPYKKEQHQYSIDNKDERHLLVINKKTNKKLGFIILAGLENKNLCLEFRRIVISNKEKGIGRLCLKLVKKYCFENLRFHKLWLDVFDFNDRAIHLYKSEGFIEEGRLRDHIKSGKEYKTLILLSMLENEYFKS